MHTRSKGTYGTLRSHAELTEAGAPVSRKRVTHLMRAADLQSISRRRRPRTTLCQLAA